MKRFVLILLICSGLLAAPVQASNLDPGGGGVWWHSYWSAGPCTNMWYDWTSYDPQGYYPTGYWRCRYG